MTDTQHPNPFMVTTETWAEEHAYPSPFALALVMADRLEHRLAGFAAREEALA